MSGWPKPLGATILAGLLLTACVVEVPVEEVPGDAEPDDVSRVPHGAELAGGVGSEAVTFLRDDVPRMVVEVKAVEGHELSDEALEHLVSVMDEVLDKSEGIELRVATIPETAESYDGQDLVDLEAEHREVPISADVASVLVLSLNGDFRDAPVVGVAYSGSSFAIFPETMEEASSPLASRAAMERAVLVHEMGHLLRLVNVGYESPRDRENTDHPHHSVNEDSVMHWAVQSASLADVLEGGPPDTFDDDDRADLEDLKAGRLP